MVKTLFRAILLVGLGIGAGFVHAQLNRNGENPLILKLPTQSQPATGEKGPDSPPGETRPATEAPKPEVAPQAPKPETTPTPEQPPAAPATPPAQPAAR